jgi:hypothetical protein
LIPLHADRSVKVLSEKTGTFGNFQKSDHDFKPVPMEAQNLSDEFKRLLQLN